MDCETESATKKRRKSYRLHLKKQLSYQERTDVFSFYPKFGKLRFTVSPSSYFDDRPEIIVYLTTIISILGFSMMAILPTWTLFVWAAMLFVPWGQCFFHLPLYSGISECEHPEYGFYLYSDCGLFNCFVLCYGMKTKHYDMPWHLEWYRSSSLRKDEKWEHEFRGDRKWFYEDKWNDILWNESHPYSYALKSGEVQNRTATLKVEEREWRPKWFMWTSLFAHISRTIDVRFDGEVGERSGSWKGGTIGCSYGMKDGELPEQTLRRMENERKFT